MGVMTAATSDVHDDRVAPVLRERAAAVTSADQREERDDDRHLEHDAEAEQHREHEPERRAHREHRREVASLAIASIAGNAGGMTRK